MAKRATLLGGLLGGIVALGSGAQAASTDPHPNVAAAAARAAVAPQAVPTPRPSIVIDFTGDTPGAKPNGFASVASPDVTFSDTNGTDLQIGDFGNQSHGQAIAVLPDDDSALRITLAKPTTKISLSFGNDDPSASEPGDEAVLTLFRGTTMVGQARVTMNRNDLMDQTISFGPQALFNRAVLQFDTVHGLIEVVDDIVIAPLCTIAGTEGPDVLNGTDGPDVICGGGGNDIINAKGGNDVVFAGLGNDRVSGGPGHDEIHGGLGNDTLNGDAGDDFITADEGNDKLNGGAGKDQCRGGTGTDTASGCEIRVSIP